MLILHYFRVALRNLQQFKVYSALSVICLAVGLLSFSMIYNFNRSADEGILSLPDVERRVVPVFENADGHQLYRILNYTDLSELENLQLPGVDRIIGVGFASDMEWYVSNSDGEEGLHRLIVCPLWGDLLADCGAHLYYGDRLPQRPDEVVLSASAARKLCGDANPIGLTMRLAFSQGLREDRWYRVVNVVEDFDFSTYWDAEVYRMICEEDLVPYTTAFLTLAPGCDAGQLADRIMQSPMGSRVTASGAVLRLCPLTERYARSQLEILLRTVIVLVFALVLLSGFICFLMFIIHRFYNRQRELALRKMMGSKPVSLSMLLFAECFWVLTMALVVTLPLTEIAVDWVNGYSQDCLQLKAFRSVSGIMLTEVVVYLVLLLLCWFIAQIPVWRLRRVSVIRYVVRNRRRHAVRNTMLCVQLTISMFLTGLLVGLMVTMRVVNDKIVSYLTEEEEEHIVMVDFTSRSMRDRSREVIATLQRQMQPQETTFVNNLITTSTTVGGQDVLCDMRYIASNYCAFFHIPIETLTADTVGVGGAYVSRELYDLLTANGETVVRVGNYAYDVVGVYPESYGVDFGTYVSPSGPKRFLVMILVGDDELADQYYMRLPERAGDGVLKTVAGVCNDIVPGSSLFKVRYIGRRGSEQALFGFYGQLVLLLAVISLLLTIIGIYTAVSMDTVGRQKEMALRKIYGATAWGIARHFVRLYAVLLLVALAISVPLLVAVFYIIFYPGDLVGEILTPVWALVTLLIVASCVLLSIFTRIRRIVRINPVDFIRTE